MKTHDVTKLVHWEKWNSECTSPGFRAFTGLFDSTIKLIRVPFSFTKKSGGPIKSKCNQSFAYEED